MMASTQTGDSPVDQAKEKAQQAGEQARGRVRDEVDRRSTEIGEQATTVADAIRQSSQQMRDQGQGSAARPVEQIADRVESAGRWMRESDGDRILRDVEDFGRRNPLAVVAGGIAVGFALSRLLKASSTQRYESGRGQSRSSGTNGTGLPAPTSTQPRGVAGPDLPSPEAPSPYGTTEGTQRRPTPPPPTPGDA